MADQESLDALIAAVQEVLNVQAFMIAEAVAIDQVEPPDEPCLQATIDYQGVAAGTVDLIFPTSLAAELAANILGVSADELDDPAEAGDALKELVNIVCGQYLTRRFGTAPVFDLSIPKAQDAPLSVWDDWSRDAAAVALDVDFTPVLARLRQAAVE